MNFKYFQSRFIIRDGKLQQEIESAGPEEGRIDNVRPVGCCQNNDPLEFFNAVHLAQELADDAIHHMGCGFRTPPGNHAVYFIKKDDTWRCLPGLFENFPYPLFTLSNPFGKEFRAFDRNEIDF